MNATVEKDFYIISQHQLGEFKVKASKKQMQPVFCQRESEVDTLALCVV